MDSRRAETLEALSAYIQTQKSLLSRAEADIDKLRKLRADALSQPKAFAENIGSKFNGPGLRLSENNECSVSPLANEVHWQVFSSADPTPLRTFAVRKRLAHTEWSVPHTTQHSPLSSLQQFVKDARRIIIDPVLGSFDPDNAIYLTSNSNLTTSAFHASLDQPTLSEDEAMEEEKERKSPPVQESFTATRRRERAHAKIQKLKERKITYHTVAENGEAANAVFVRNDVDDESGEVDISESSLWPSVNDSTSMDVDDSTDMTVPSTPSTIAPPELAQPLTSWSKRRTSTINQRLATRSDNLNRPSRSRKPYVKLQPQSPDSNLEASAQSMSITIPPLSILGKRSRNSVDVKINHKFKAEPSPPAPEPKADIDKPRPETYKQAWSVSEQHLLERLLEEIPDGERNRWAKISQAMGGRRTPRQVASRVQKYFEKLKRFGVGVEKKLKTSSRS
ncbi:uncharacterized protein BJ212DRAFT_1343689 [Suillus subaureus]|uniref:HTH myb-type domain-containing protein n=1 Tax=Suillus subaureus TaxID=48587 RepID=A0A9P7JER3_9AGAM|nr:uncharacterized protein BJ212DRAFT_1343689 [Suillus subaureus]KAG1818984.1 hypothetical protein BJ212DRAFT_1343689 [Suillus subaureus]